MLFREALHSAFIDLQDARDVYRNSTHGQDMHRDLVARYIEVQTLLLSPIAPHTTEHIWCNVLQRPQSIMRAAWPALTASGVDITVRAHFCCDLRLCSLVTWQVLRSGKYLFDFVGNMRKRIETLSQPPRAKKGAAPAAAPARPNAAQVYIAAEYPTWQRLTLIKMRELYNEVR